MPGGKEGEDVERRGDMGGEEKRRMVVREGKGRDSVRD